MKFSKKLSKILEDFSRRDFLKRSGAVAANVAMGGNPVSAVLRSANIPIVSKYENMSPEKLLSTPEHLWMPFISPGKMSQLIQYDPKHGGYEIINKVLDLIVYGANHNNNLQIIKALSKWAPTNIKDGLLNTPNSMQLIHSLAEALISDGIAGNINNKKVDELASALSFISEHLPAEKVEKYIITTTTHKITEQTNITQLQNAIRKITAAFRKAGVMINPSPEHYITKAKTEISKKKAKKKEKPENIERKIRPDDYIYGHSMHQPFESKLNRALKLIVG